MDETKKGPVLVSKTGPFWPLLAQPPSQGGLADPGAKSAASALLAIGSINRRAFAKDDAGAGLAA